MEVEEITTSEVVDLLTNISVGINLQVHLMYLLIIIICGYGLYRLYTYVFRRFF